MASISDTDTPSETTQSNSDAGRALKGKDGFFSTLYRFFDGLGHHTTGLAIAVGVVIAIGVAFSMFSSRREVRSQAAKGAYFLAQQSLENELKAEAGVKESPQEAAPPAADKTPLTKEQKEAKAKEEAAKAKAKSDQDVANAKLMETVAFKKLDVDAKFPQATQKLKALIQEYSGTRAAFEAQMTLGTLYFNHGQAAQAATQFQSAVSAAPAPLEKALALSSLGYAHENAAKYNEALEAFNQAANLGEGAIKGDLLLAVARCQEALNDTTKARSTYDQIISQLPDSEAAKSAQIFKARL